MERQFIIKRELKAVVAAIFLMIFGVGEVERLEAAVTASSLAIIGYNDISSSFTVVALDTLSAGEVIYFTNNGWKALDAQFNGADAMQGAGNESLIKLTLNQTVNRGSVISSLIDTASWVWNKSGDIPDDIPSGLGGAVFSDLSFSNESDQIYAFQATNENPLLNPTNFIYALHFGSTDYPFFSNLDYTLTGDVPPGLSTITKTAFSHTNFGFHSDPIDGSHSAWGLSMSAVQSLQTSGGTKSQWLNAIANSENWAEGEPTEDLNVLAAPEPSRSILAAFALMTAFLRRRRPATNHIC